MVTTQNSNNNPEVIENTEGLPEFSLSTAFHSKDEYLEFVKDIAVVETMVPAFTIKSIYKRWTEKGQMSKGKFHSIGEEFDMKGENKIPCVRWVEPNGDFFHCSAVILVDDCKKANLQKGMPIEITFLGKKDPAKSSSPNTFKVTLLKPSPIKKTE